MAPARSRMVLLIGPALLLTLAATAASSIVLCRQAWPLDVLMVALLGVGYARTSLTATGSLLGLAGSSRASRRGPLRPARTALLVPIYNEAPAPVAMSVTIMADRLERRDNVTVFVLSDTQDPDLVEAEAALFPAVAVAASGVAVHYRRRPANTGRKAGNIGEFCRNAGRAFDDAIVLDADSLMTADAIRALIARLQGDTHACLVQSVTYPVASGTLFGRMQQFAARLHTPLTAAGQHRWQGGRGTFWGHNAIFRIAAFSAHANLPTLAGPPPMGGEVLCHDTIEAALLLRAGWEVRMAPDIAGSYETTPGNLVDHLARERRWCQGNLQHLRLIGASRLRAESRLHILIGILHYVSAPAGLVLGVLLLADRSAGQPPPGIRAAALWMTIVLLFAPRLSSLLHALVSPAAARGFGGRARLLASALAEQLGALLTSPLLMLSVTGFVLSTLARRVVVWNAPARGDRGVGWTEAWRRFGCHTAVGLATLLAACLFRPAALPWLSPLLPGLLLSIPLAVASGSVRLGRLSRRLGLFLTEDELTPTGELAALTAMSARSGHRPNPQAAAERVRAAPIDPFAHSDQIAGLGLLAPAGSGREAADRRGAQA